MVADADIQLLKADEDGKTLFASSITRGKDKETIIMEGASKGDYVLEVTPFGAAKTKYQLTMTASGVGPDLDGGDNGKVPSKLVKDLGALSEAKSFDDQIGFGEGTNRDQNDFYKFTVSQDTPVKITLTPDIGNANLEVRDKFGSLLYLGQNSGTTKIVNEEFEPGGYYVRVFPSVADRTFYNLTISQDILAPVISNISIQDVNITEGNSGQKNANFQVTLDKVSNKTVTVKYSTVDDTAKAGQDFVKKAGQITFKPGVKTQNISVPIIGDKVFEPNEIFNVKLSQASNGTITKANAIGTITNDDQKVVVLPNISIGNVSITEGNSGQKNANFQVTLDKVSNKTVTVKYSTVDDTAKAGQDFVKKSGQVTFKPGVKTQNIAVPIIGDKLFETNEKFTVKLSQASQGKITKDNAIGTITNDDSGDVVIPTIPLEDKEPDNNSISKNLPTFSNISHEPIRVTGNVGFLAGSQRDQQDYYRLVLDQSENDVYIALDALQQDANIEILGQDGSTKLFSSENTGKTPDSISQILSAGTYYVRVYPKSSNGTPYRLSINM